MHPINRRDFARTFGTAALTVAAGTVHGDEPPRRDRIKVGQIGVGHAHASKLAVYRKSPDYEVVGVVEPDAALRKRAESQPPYKGLPFLTRDKLLATPGLQAVLVETPVEGLLAAAEACVAAGKHVHIDKPAGDSFPQFKRILE